MVVNAGRTTLHHVWAGVDIGKGHHHTVVIDPDGARVLSRRVINDETALLELISQVTALADQVDWAVDMSTGGSALLLALLAAHGQRVFYISGNQVNRAAGGYRGEGKTDAKDAAIIADQVRMRRDLTPMRVDEELVVELRMLVGRRRDLAGDRVRLVNRLHDQLLAISPALERALDLTNRGPLVLLTRVQTPTASRRLGAAVLEEWLWSQKVRSAAELAAKAMTAANSQHTTLPGEGLAAELVADMAKGVMSLDEQLKHTDKLIEGRFRRHRSAEVLVSMPGIGVLPGAEFLAATGGDMTAFASADHLAGYAGLAPAPRDSGRISGNLHRPRRYHRGLQRAFYTSALVSIRCNDQSRVFYDRKRSEGKRHTQAVLALARRRVNVVWALLRDNRCYTPVSPSIAAAA
jgi:transposase